MNNVLKMLFAVVGAMTAMVSSGYEWTDPNTGLIWGYSFEAVGVTIGRPYPMVSDLVIPSTVNGNAVRGIRLYSYNFCEDLTSIVIPSSVISIGEAAFQGCNNVTKITIADDVMNMSIGQAAFRGCSGLTSITIPGGITNISDNAFEGCSGMISYMVDESNPMYKSCNGLLLTKDGKRIICGVNGDVIIPDGVTKISATVFSGRSNLTSITIPSSVTSIGDSAFSDCVGLTSVTIPSSVTNIGSSAFSGCIGLSSITIADGVTCIGDNAFEGCCGLTSVAIPSSVTSIGNSAFSGCGGLMSVRVPSLLRGVGQVGEMCFSNCDNLRKVTFVGDAPKSLSGWNASTKICYLKEYESSWKELLGDVGVESNVYCVDPQSTPSGSGSSFTGNIVVTNVVIHYVVNSIQSTMAAPVSTDTKLVNVMTEIKGGNVSIPDTWAANYPTFNEKFGSDFTASLTKATGKVDAAGSPMFVWQDFVAGTDPTNPEDKFTASVTMVGGKPVISYSPELSVAESAKRKYTIWGKEKLQDEKWIEVPEGEESDYNFFKVTVEMK